MVCHQRRHFPSKKSSNKPPNKEVICIIWNIIETLLILLNYHMHESFMHAYDYILLRRINLIFEYNFTFLFSVKLLYFFLHFSWIRICIWYSYYHAKYILNVEIDRFFKKYIGNKINPLHRITFNRKEMMVFRPLLCTLIRLNWAKHTPGIMRRN